MPTAVALNSLTKGYVDDILTNADSYVKSKELYGDYEYHKRQSELAVKLARGVDEADVVSYTEQQVRTAITPKNRYVVMTRDKHSVEVTAERVEAKSSLIFYNGKNPVYAFAVGNWVHFFEDNKPME